MKVGVPTEIKTDEYRVALTPSACASWSSTATRSSSRPGRVRARRSPTRLPGPGRDHPGRRRHGVRRGGDDRQGQGAAARGGRAAGAAAHPLHRPAPGARPRATAGLMDFRCDLVAYETVTDARGRLPLLAPISEVAGKIATQAGAFMLEKPFGGRGMLVAACPACRRPRDGDRRRRRRHERGVHRLGMEAEVYVYDRNSTACASSTCTSPAAPPRATPRTLEIEQRLPGHGPRDRRGARSRRQGAVRSSRREQLGR